MSLNNLADFYLSLFYYLGQNTFHPRHNPPLIFSFAYLYRRLPIVIYFLTFSSAAWKQLSTFPLMEFKFYNIVYFVLIILSVLIYVVVIVQALFSSERCNNVWVEFNKFEVFAVNEAQMQILVKPCARDYSRQVIFQILFFLAYTVGKVICCCNVRNMTRKLSFSLIMFWVLVANFHVLFYINILSYLVYSCNRHMVTVFQNKVYNGNIDISVKSFLVNFKMFKHLHYKLWDISQIISKRFGWLLILLILHSLNNATQTFFWILTSFYAEDVGIFLISM